MFTLPERFTAPVERARAARHTLTQPHILATAAVTVTATVALGAVGIAPSDAAETAAVTAAASAPANPAPSVSEIAIAAQRAETAASRAAQQRSDIKAREAAAAKAKAKKAAAARKAKALANAQKNPKAVAQSLLGDYGFGSGQWQCLETLWTGESGWKYTAANTGSGAYGIPQALPGSKMGTIGADWRTNPATQIRWGLQYIKATYGSPCAALGAWNSRYPHWY